MTARPYRPSNSSEGDIFYNAWCMNCRHEDHDRHPCEIFSATLVLDAGHPNYPKEWVEDENGPRCTKFERGAPLSSADEKYLNWKAQRDLRGTHR